MNLRKNYSIYKDIFDFYYLIENNKLNRDKLINCIEILILNDDSVHENTIKDIFSRISNTLNSQRYRNNLTNPKVNWLEISIDDAINKVLDYIGNLERIII